MGEVDFDYLVDVHSSREGDNKEFDNLKDLIKEEYLFFSKYLNDLYFIESNIVYLNYVAKVPQVKISEIFNIKQYGVSKRISSALRRLAIQLKAPDTQLEESYFFLSKIVPHPKAYVLVVWYALKTISAVSLSVRASNSVVSKLILEIKEVLEAYMRCETLEEFMVVMADNLEVEEIDEKFLEELHKDYSYFLVVKHKMKSHIEYITELQQYNSRGSHNFRKDWH